MTKSYNPATLVKIDAELAEAGYDMPRSWVALCVDGVVHGVGTTKAEARRVAPPKHSEEARAARAPRAPEELVGALQDRIHPTSGRLLAAKPIASTLAIRIPESLLVRTH